MGEREPDTVIHYHVKFILKELWEKGNREKGERVSYYTWEEGRSVRYRHHLNWVLANQPLFPGRGIRHAFQAEGTTGHRYRERERRPHLGCSAQFSVSGSWGEDFRGCGTGSDWNCRQKKITKELGLFSVACSEHQSRAFCSIAIWSDFRLGKITFLSVKKMERRKAKRPVRRLLQCVWQWSKDRVATMKRRCHGTREWGRQLHGTHQTLV